MSLLRACALMALGSMVLSQGTAHPQRVRSATLGSEAEWTAIVAGGGSMEVSAESHLSLKSPLSTAVCFLQRTVPIEGDYVFEVVARGVKSDLSGAIFLGACNGPLPDRGDIGAACDANAKVYSYPYGWLGVESGDHALVTVRGPNDYVNWDGSAWVEKWARTGVPLSPEATYRFRLERRGGEYALSVLDDQGAAIVAPPPVRVEDVSDGDGSDTLVIGDPWSAHTTMELEVISVTVNDEPVEFGEAGEKLGSPLETYGDDQIEVTVGEPFTISSSIGHYNFPTLKQISEKELFVAIWASPDAALQPEDCNVACVWTQDGGRTWGEPVMFHGKELGGHSWIRRKDGTCVWLSYFCRPIDEKTVSCNVGHSDDGKAYSWSTGTVTFPEPIKPWVEGNVNMVFARSILEMDDGSLLATMYGYFEEDKSNRSILVRSTDGGTNWEYYATMAHDEDRAGHLNEPVVERLANGDILCVMRNESNLPMWSVRSSDDGRSWTRPRQLPSYATSVFPDMVLMSNGILAVSFGRPGAHIMFSVDGKGRRWTSRIAIHAEGNTDAYTDIREVAPGRLLYIHHESITNEEGQRENAIRGVFVDVKKK